MSGSEKRVTANENYANENYATVVLSPDLILPSDVVKPAYVVSDQPADVNCVLALLTSRLIVTAAEDGEIRVFALHADGILLRTIPAHNRRVYGLACVGDGYFASGAYDDCNIYLWNAKNGKRVGRFKFMAERFGVRVMTATRDGLLIVGTFSGDVIVMSCNSSFKLSVVHKVTCPSNNYVRHLSTHGNLIVASGSNEDAYVLNMSITTPQAILRGHKAKVRCTDISEHFVVTCSDDQTIRVYEKARSFSLVRELIGFHSESIRCVNLIGEELVMSSSCSGAELNKSCVCFVSLPACDPVARFDIAIDYISSIAITPSGQIACAGYGDKRSVVLNPPPVVASAVKKHALSIFSPSPSPSPAPAEAQGRTQAALASGNARRTLGELGELKAAFSKTEELRSLSVDHLSKVVAGAMIDFRVEFSQHLVSLSNCLRKVFVRLGIAGDVIVSFDEAKIMPAICEALRGEAEYVLLGDFLMETFEWRLRGMLRSLRLKN